MAQIKKAIFGSARIDENGNAHGGKAGDQTGREVSTQDYYIHSKGWRVFRPKTARAAAKLAYAMGASCANDNIGYDQYENQSLLKAARPVGYDPAKVVTKCETDCCRLVRVCCLHAGIALDDCYTATEPQALINTKAFTEIKCDSSYTPQAGDILVTKTKGHTGIITRDTRTTISAIAMQVVNGWWGNGDARKLALKGAGWDYAAVQAEVNRILRG